MSEAVFGMTPHPGLVAAANDGGNRIVKAEVFAAPIPFVRPFRQAKGLITQSETVFVRLEDAEGRVGWGEGYNVVIIYGRDHKAIYSAVANNLLAVVKGRTPIEVSGLVNAMDSTLPDNYDAKCAVEMALYDLLGKQLGVSLSELLGGRNSDEVPVVGALPMKSPEVEAAAARSYVSKGFKHLKLKVGEAHNWQIDVERILSVREAVGDDISMVADANANYDRRVALQVLSATEEAQLDHFEQPLQRNDIDGMAWLAANTSTPIAADESLHQLRDAMQIHKANAASAYILKLIKQGGIYRCRQMAEFASAVGVTVHMSGGTETSLAAAALLHLRATMPSVRGGVEYLFVLKEDVTTRSLAIGPQTAVPTGPGLGVEVDRNKLDRYIRQQQSA